MEHVYIGSCTEFLTKGQKYERLGDVANFTDEQAEEYVRGGAQFISKAEFDSCQFTPEELRKYAYSGPRRRAPAEFLAKVEKATDIFRTNCNRLRAQQLELEAVVVEPEPERAPEPVAPAQTAAAESSAPEIDHEGVKE